MDKSTASLDEGCGEVRSVVESPNSALFAEIESHAVEIARGAGEILRREFGSPLKIEYKDARKRDPVTQVD